ncbi:MAG: hypothetical protein B6I20_13610 [Bacteroidetes bacterium 4572_117]|nr:MAG: hypothetical protein B6I20_13610 [Bacteroidetes bacterium 4572_117]
MKTTRRDFIKISSIGAGTIAAGTPIMNFITSSLDSENLAEGFALGEPEALGCITIKIG